MEKFIGTALVVGIIGPLFWLGVNMLEGWMRRRTSAVLLRLRTKRAQQPGPGTQRRLL